MRSLGASSWMMMGTASTPGPMCMGCDDLNCILKWRKANLPRSNTEAIMWMDGHKFFTRRCCPDHPEAKLLFHKGKTQGQAPWFECTHVKGKDDSGRQVICRRRFGLLTPYQSNKSQGVSAHDLLNLWWKCSANVSTGTKASELDTHRSTVSILIRQTALACYKSLENNAIKMVNVQVDETYIGTRKGHRGKRVRRIGFWFVSVTEVCPKSGKSLRTRWYPVDFRTKDELTRIVSRHLLSSRSVVTTDSFRSYQYFAQIWRHRQVNHSKCFAYTDQATGRIVHTNNAENSHSVIKSWLKKEFHRYGTGGQNLLRNLAIQQVKFDKDSADQKGCWQKKYINILRAVRSHYVHFDRRDHEDVPNIDVDEKSAEYRQAMDDWRKRYEAEIVDDSVQMMKDVSVKATVDGKVKYVRANVVVDDPTLKWEFGKPYHRRIVKDVLKSCNEGHMLESHAITFCLPLAAEVDRTSYLLLDPEVLRLSIGKSADELQKLHIGRIDDDILAPINIDKHWVLVVWSSEQQLFMLDSMPKKRSALVMEVKTLFEMKLGITIDKIHTAKCEEQAVGSNDCGLHVINNALAFLEPTVLPTVTRRTMYAMMSSKDAEKEWQHYFLMREDEDWFLKDHRVAVPRKKPRAEKVGQKLYF
eukprot:GILK01012483.1.p1 GENE.GILK01012483.1~~GILK01012483.1.p1  ORF type:complete len:642 (+),score=34.82 GILK01012483.1:388-2313(+)